MPKHQFTIIFLTEENDDVDKLSNKLRKIISESINRTTEVWYVEEFDDDNYDDYLFDE